MPYIRDLLRQIESQGAFPAGHYYSPIPDKDEVVAYNNSRKPQLEELPGIRINNDQQFRILNQYARYYEDLPFPEKQKQQSRYYYDNSFFLYSDAIFLYSFLRMHKPRRIIEIGSGFSSAVFLDTIDRIYSEPPDITFIEPDPVRLKQLLHSKEDMHFRVIEGKIQDIKFDIFSSLGAGDLLFIDSSHVVKCGSDLHILFNDILPRLSDRVFVHFHDIFYPFDYPPEWLEQGRYWNENYFLRAFLSYNAEWEIYFFNSYVALAFNDFIREKMPLCIKDSGGSIYIQRKRYS